MKAVAIGGTLLLFNFAAMTPGHGNEVSCPKLLPATEQSAPTVPDGWVARNSPARHKLNGVSINLGDPKDKSDAAIYDERSVEKGADGVGVETLVWHLAHLRDPYLVCSYFSTNVTLVRSLAGLSQCKVVNAARARGSSSADIRSATCL